MNFTKHLIGLILLTVVVLGCCFGFSMIVNSQDPPVFQSLYSGNTLESVPKKIPYKQVPDEEKADIIKTLPTDFHTTGKLYVVKLTKRKLYFDVDETGTINGLCWVN